MLGSGESVHSPLPRTVRLSFLAFSRVPAVTSPSSSIQASTENINVRGTRPLVSPKDLKQQIPISESAKHSVVETRESIQKILRGEDPRLLVVVGPCSIHDVEAAREFGSRLAELRKRVADRMLVVMRVYFEKPRTTVGWKGLINDPHLDGTFDMNHGLELARKLLVDLTEMGLATGTEFLDPFTPQYIDDLIAWAAIGARTTESQTHRQMASGLTMPVGFKNGTDGGLTVAVDAMTAARSPHAFLGIDDDGHACVFMTSGNQAGHVILRGGGGKTNYHPQDVAQAAEKLEKASVPPKLMVDCSHANSGKKHENQPGVFNSLVEQRAQAGTDSPIIGVMVEANINEGNQSIPENIADLKYGVSITDACINWQTTEQLLLAAYDTLG